MDIVNVLHQIDDSFLKHPINKIVSAKPSSLTSQELDSLVEFGAYKMITKSVIVNMVQNQKLTEEQLSELLKKVETPEGVQSVAHHALVNLDVEFEDIKTHVVLASTSYQ